MDTHAYNVYEVCVRQMTATPMLRLCRYADGSCLDGSMRPSAACIGVSPGEAVVAKSSFDSDALRSVDGMRIGRGDIHAAGAVSQDGTCLWFYHPGDAVVYTPGDLEAVVLCCERLRRVYTKEHRGYAFGASYVDSACRLATGVSFLRVRNAWRSVLQQYDHADSFEDDPWMCMNVVAVTAFNMPTLFCSC